MEGKCYCEKIHFKFTPVNGVAVNCYCSICSRLHGAAHTTQVISTKDSLEFVTGETDIAVYEASDLGVRAFCANCGSRLMNYATNGSNYMCVSLAAVTGDHEIKPSVNLHVASKVVWANPEPDIPCYDEFSEDFDKYF